MNKPVTIIGCGPGARAYLTIEAIDAVAAAEVIVGAPRVLALFPDSRAERIVFGDGPDMLISSTTGRVPSPSVPSLLDVIAERRERCAIAVLVTGDPGVHSLARPVVERFGIEDCRVIPGIGSVQLALARLGLDGAETRILSAHHRLPDIDSAELAAFETIAILTGHASACPWIQSLAETLTGDYRIVVLSNLGLPDERIEELTVAGDGPDMLTSSCPVVENVNMSGPSPSRFMSGPFPSRSIVILTRRSVDT